MAEPTNNVNGAASPSQAPQPAMTMSDTPKIAPADAFLEVPELGGGTRLVPVSEAIKEVGELGAGRRLLNEAKELRANVHLDREHAQRYRDLERQLSDPNLAPAAFEGIKNMARMRGVDVDAVIAHATPHDGTTHQPSPSAPARTGETSQLDQRLQRLEQRENDAQFQRELDGHLSRYPGLTGAKRELVVESVLARATLQRDKPLQQVVNEVFNDFRHVRVDEPTPTQVRDARLQAQAIPSVNPAAGSPQLTDIPAPTGASLKNGGDWAEGTRRFIRQAMSTTDPRPH